MAEKSASVTQNTEHMGFKTSALVLGTILWVLWTVIFVVGQLLPAMLGLWEGITVNWQYYIFGVIIVVVQTALLMLLHVLWKLIYAGEKYIK